MPDCCSSSPLRRRGKRQSSRSHLQRRADCDHVHRRRGILDVEKTLEIADGAEEFADKTVKLYWHMKRLKQLSDSTQDYIKAHFSVDGAWDVIKEDFTR